MANTSQVDVEMERGVIAISAQRSAINEGPKRRCRSSPLSSTDTSHTNYNHVLPQIWFLEIVCLAKTVLALIAKVLPKEVFRHHLGSPSRDESIH